jgi:hypothetical protein
MTEVRYSHNPVTLSVIYHHQNPSDPKNTSALSCIDLLSTKRKLAIRKCLKTCISPKENVQKLVISPQ